MDTVNENTELLISIANTISTCVQNSDENYNILLNLLSDNCFERIKSSLNISYDSYINKCDELATKLCECAYDLEDINNQIANDVEGLYSNNMDSEEIISSLTNMSDADRKQILSMLSSSLTNVVRNIEEGKDIQENSSDNSYVNGLVNKFIEQVSTTDADGNITYKVNDLIKNEFYNDIIKQYGELADVTITPDMLHYAGRSGQPIIRENDELTVTESHNTCNIGDEYNFYKMGTAYMNETSSPYSSELYNNTGSYERKYSFYPDSMAYHYNSRNWYICDDGFYRDDDGYIICADRYNMSHNDGPDIISNNDAYIVDTPFGLGKVYDFCEEGNIDIYVHR